jgi:hypothetical protein
MYTFKIDSLRRQTSALKCFASRALFLGMLISLSSLAFSQDSKKADNPPPPRTPSSKPEVCAPAEKASQKTASPVAVAETSVSGTSEAASTASDDTISQEQPSLKLRSSIDDRQDLLAVDCSKEPDASSAACQRKQSKAAANQCERTEGDSDLTLRKN